MRPELEEPLRWKREEKEVRKGAGLVVVPYARVSATTCALLLTAADIAGVQVPSLAVRNHAGKESRRISPVSE